MFLVCCLLARLASGTSRIRSPGASRRRGRARGWRFALGVAFVAAASNGEAAEKPGAIEAAPLAPRSVPPPGSSTMFTQLSPEQTGVRAMNSYDDPKMWGDKFEVFAYGSMGTGVAIGDYDGDGRPDVFVVCKTGRNHLFRNLGDWRFEDVTDAAGVGGPTDAWKGGAAFVDVNNDGRLDLYVCRIGAPNLLYINQGDGTFAERAHESGLDVADASVMGSFGDFDRDGWLDLFLVTNLLDREKHPEGQRDYLFRNRGDGTFVNVTQPAGIFGEGQRHAAIWWDYDQDGWPDIYVTYDYGWPDQLFHNNGDGTFTNTLGRVLPHIPRFSMGVDCGDVNNDGLVDLFVPDMLPTTRERDQRSMIDARAHIADLPDFAMTPQYVRNALFINTGTARFQEGAFLAGLAATDWTWSPRLEDLDNDGRLDLFVCNGTIREFFDVDLRRQIDGLLPEERKRVIKASPVLREHHLAFRNLGDLHFENVSAAWGLDQLGVSFGAAFGDLDGDGDLDVVFANFNGDPTVCRNDSSSGHRVIVALRGTVSNRFGVGATVRIETAAGPQVRQLTVARGYMSSSEPILHFGLGTDERVSRLTVEWPSGQVQRFANLAADQRYTITEPIPAVVTRPSLPAKRETETQFVEVGEPTGLDVVQAEKPVDEFAAQPLLPLRQNSMGPGVAIGDVNGDRVDDVVIGGSAGQAARVMIAGNEAKFSPGDSTVFSPAAAVADAAPLLIDVDGDGRNDLFLPKGGVAAPAGSPAYQPQLYLNRGQGVFEPAPAGALPTIPTSAGPAVAADFNHDGRLDIFVGGRVVPGAHPLSPPSMLLLNQGGSFVDVTEKVAPGLAHVGMVAAALWTDVDGDGWTDLLLALQWGGVRCWRNLGGTRFADWSERSGFASAGSGWWNSVAAADFNGDGRLDYAVGNLGLNTRYHATREEPTVLLSGVFDESGRINLIEAEYDQGRLVPGRGRSTLELVMPSLFRKFPTFKAYATATLSDLVPADRLQAAQRFAATEFRSGVFLSQPDGTYRFEPLPRIAQIAPVFGMVAGDFNGDGKADLYVVQNSYAPIPETGRFDGGVSQLLCGDGHGHFTPVPPQVSGLIVPGDAKALAVIDLDRDGWPDFLVTRNNDRVLVFANTGIAGRQSLRVVLRGPPGNPTAVGARIAMELADGSTQTCEVCAGSGYCSQSTAACFFGFPDSNPPRNLRVRWPSGRITDLPGPAHGGTLAVSAPAL